MEQTYGYSDLMSPEDAYDQLSRALEMRAPQCNGDARFTEDRVTAAVAKDVAKICATCDVALLCRRYATAAQPKVGYWAGHRYGVPGRTAQREDGVHEAVENTRPKRDPAVTAAEKRIAWCRAHAARLRDGVARGDLEPWYLDAATQYETDADQVLPALESA